MSLPDDSSESLDNPAVYEFLAPAGTLFIVDGSTLILTSLVGGEVALPLSDLHAFLAYPAPPASSTLEEEEPFPSEAPGC
jgi:hypothetical protein